jgi:hypothetical protein
LDIPDLLYIKRQRISKQENPVAADVMRVQARENAADLMITAENL